MLNDTIDRNRQRRRRIHNRRRQRVKRQLMLIGTVLILLILSIISCTANHIQKKKAQETAKIEKEEKKKEEKKEKEEETPGERLVRVRQEAETAGCPKEILDLLSKNEETTGFVEHYASKKDEPPADTVGEVKQGVIPQLLQWDERWGYAPYGTSTVAVSGCGPTCMSMVLTGLTGDASITPARVAEYGTQNGYLDDTNDTMWLFMEEVSQNWGVSCYETNSDETVVATELASGRPIICSMGPGDFTRNGHFIVLTGYENGNVTVHDPFSQANSDKVWVYAEIVDQFQAMWAYYI